MQLKLRLLYLLYYLLSGRERHMYALGQAKGMQVVAIKYDALGAVVTYDPERKPTPGFLTWEEFKAARASNE